MNLIWVPMNVDMIETPLQDLKLICYIIESADPKWWAQMHICKKREEKDVVMQQLARFIVIHMR